MRLQLFEFEDLPWFPNKVREGATDYLRYLITALEFYKPALSVIQEGLKQTEEKVILDLCSGGGGPASLLAGPFLQQNVKLYLSDKYPNIRAFEYLKNKNKAIDYVSHSVDATAVHPALKGFRTMFSATHHFKPSQLKKILQDACGARQGIALFDSGDKHPGAILAIILLHPILLGLLTPFFKPFRFSRFLFTYLIPLIPLVAIWDGCVSILRLYKAEELLALAKSSDQSYTWKAGKLKSKGGLTMTYLLGYPNKDLIQARA